MFCHSHTSMFLSFPHALLALSVHRKLAFATLWPPKATVTSCTLAASWAGQLILEFLQTGKNTSSTTSQTAFHATCRDWPQLHLTQQLLGHLQPVLLISKPCTVKLCMLVSSWLHHGHPRPLICCHDPKHLLHLLWTSETKSWFKLSYNTFLLELFPTLSYHTLILYYVRLELRGVTSAENWKIIKKNKS